MPHPLSFATHDLGLLALRFQRNHEPASFSIGLELLVSPQIAPPPQPFALADIVCDRYASGEHHSHACAALFSTRCTAGAMDAVVEPTTSRAPWSRRSRRSSTFLAMVGADGMREVRASTQRRVAASRGAAFSVLMHPCDSFYSQVPVHVCCHPRPGRRRWDWLPLSASGWSAQPC